MFSSRSLGNLASSLKQRVSALFSSNNNSAPNNNTESTNSNASYSSHTSMTMRLSNTGIGYGTKLVMGSLAFLNYLQEVTASTLYATEKSSSTTYKVDYNANDLPNMYAALLDYCRGFTISPDSLKSFGDPKYLFCRLNDKPNGPEIGVSTEVGRQLMDNFVQCMNGAMQNVCENYHNRDNWSTPTLNNEEVTSIVVGTFALMMLGLSCCLIARKCKNTAHYERVNYDAPPPSYKQAVNNEDKSDNNHEQDGNGQVAGIVLTSVALDFFINSSSHPTPSAPPAPKNVSVSWTSDSTKKDAPGITSVGWRK